MTTRNKNNLIRRYAPLLASVLTSWTGLAAQAEAPASTDMTIPTLISIPETAHGRWTGGLGLTAWGNLMATFSIDGKGYLPNNNWTLGSEVSLLQGIKHGSRNQFTGSDKDAPGEPNGLAYGLTYDVRALYWPRPSISGPYIGPKAIVGYYDTHLLRPMKNSLSPLLLGAGADAGWTWPIGKAGGDLGIENNLVVTNYGLWYDIRFTFGSSF